MSNPSSNAAPPRSSSWQTIVLLLVMAGAIYSVSRYVLLRGNRPSGDASAAVGKAAPSVQFGPLTADKTIRLAEEKGKVVLINFWGTWCPPCRSEFPHLVKLTKPYLDRKDFQLVSVCVPGGESTDQKLKESAEDFLVKQDATFPAVVDADGSAFQLLLEAAGEKEGGIPLTMIIDREGKIAGFWMGYQPGDEEEVATVLSAALAKN